MAAPRVLTKCLAAKQQRNAVDASHGTVRHIRGSARTEAYRRPGRPPRRGRDPAPAGLNRRGGNQVVARRVVRDGERSLSCPERRTARGAAGAEWLAGQMSRDTPRLPHATAREYASIGQYRTTVRGPATLAGTGSPSKTKHHRSRPLTRPRGALLPPEADRADRTAAHVRRRAGSPRYTAPSVPHPSRRAAPPPGALVPAGPRAAQSVRRRTRPSRSSGSGAGRTDRCAGTRPRPGCR